MVEGEGGGGGLQKLVPKFKLCFLLSLSDRVSHWIFFLLNSLRFTPESSRYLLLKGKVTETEQILRRIAATNKKTYPDEPLVDPNADGKLQDLGDVRDLFRTKKMLHRTLVSWYAWWVSVD